MDHLSAVTEVFQHAVRENTKYIVHYQRRTFKHSLALIIYKRIGKKVLICGFAIFLGHLKLSKVDNDWHMIKTFDKKCSHNFP